MSLRTVKRAFGVGALFKSGVVSSVYSALTEHALWTEQNTKLIEHFGDCIPEDSLILDLGCGPGGGSAAIARLWAGRGRVVGLDFSEQMVKRAQANYSLVNLSFMQADASDMPALATGSMDFVIAHSFLYLVPDRSRVLKEIQRVLKPTGRVVFMEPREEGSLLVASWHSARSFGTILRQPSSALRMGAAMVAWRFFSSIEGRPSATELVELFRTNGFDSVTLIPTLGGIGQYVVARPSMPSKGNTRKL